MARRDSHKVRAFRVRQYTVLILFALAMLVLLGRAVFLQVVDDDFLRHQGELRQYRTVNLAAHRGPIYDRHGQPMAVSTAVDSIWVDPAYFLADSQNVRQLANLLGLAAEPLAEKIKQRAHKRFVFVKRHVTPDLAEIILSLGMPGVFKQREYKRYYPMGEAGVHVLGFTNIDDHGQEGLELALESSLRGESGAKRVIKDRLGRYVENIELVKESVPGQAVQLSIDKRLQYLLYRELKTAVAAHKAQAGSALLLNPRSGEILAMANQPAFNPNELRLPNGNAFRNRVATDQFEPGSTIKPFIIAAALDKQVIAADSVIDTRPGRFKVYDLLIKDLRNYGQMDLRSVLKKSSNVAASKIALQLDAESLWRKFTAYGFGRPTGSLYPGEAKGALKHFLQWRRVEQATMAFGYGLSSSLLQLGRAYAILASEGLRRPLTLIKQEKPVRGERVMTATTANYVRQLLESVVSREGTAYAARVSGFRIAGKTGTAKKAIAGGYAQDRYLALFAGIAPASSPELVLVVLIDEPGTKVVSGGKVAGPVFANVMRDALRLLNVAPDNLPLPVR